jgi:hypothetical protein
MSSTESTQKFLEQQLQLAEKAHLWLEYSLEQSASLKELQPHSKSDYDVLEALASRYSRFVDILINKLFRALDQFELMESGTLIDTIHRAEKRGLMTMETAREIKELRNRIVHEYDPDMIEKLAADIINYSHEALKIHRNLDAYLIEKYQMVVKFKNNIPS